MLNRVSSLLLGMLLVPCAWAATPMPATPSPEVDACLQAAGAKHGVAYVLLRAIAEQESGFNPVAIGSNPNGSYDLGLMQINTAWLPTLQRYGIAHTDLYQPCVSADVSAWLLATNFKTLGMTWRAVGAYNATTEWKRVRYATSVHNRVQRYLNRGGAAPSSSTVQPAPTRELASGTMVAWELEP